MKIKTIIGFILFLFFILISTLLVKTWIYPFHKNDISETITPLSIIPSEKAISRLVGGIRIPTISNEVYENTDFEPFDEFKAYLPKAYPQIYSTMDTLTVNNYGLVFHWKGKEKELKPILFLSHYDVVPVIGYNPSENKIEKTVFRPHDTPVQRIDSVSSTWDYPPFSGAVINGRIYGRGTLDMKGMLFSLFEAADSLIAEGWQPDRDIWFAFGHDEEVSGRQGAVYIADYFKQQGISFDAVYDEGGIIAAAGSAIESVNKPIALVGIGEKGFLTLRIKVMGVGGHSSMPPAKSSLVYAAEIIEKLNSNQMKPRIISPIASFLTNIGGEMNFMSRMTIANQWLLKPVLLNTLSESPASNGLIRTTTAISMAKGSDAPNVLTSVAEVTVNFRILPGETVNDVINHVKEICKDYEVEMEVISDREPSSISPENKRGFDIIREAVSQLYPGTIVSSYITIGGTDGYKYQIVSDNIYRFMPIELNVYEQRIIHNENEHITLENYGRMIDYFRSVMKNY